MRVLVVDDTALFRRVVSDALSGVPGVEVVGSAANGKVALARVATLRPDLITLDIEMPEMNGLEVLEALNRSGQDAGVILLSAHTVRGGELTVRGLELGAFDFLTKPAGGGAAENIAKLRDGLEPIVKAFERRRSIRSILHSNASKPAAAPPPRANPTRSTAESEPVRSLRRNRHAGSPLVLIGVSTGGPAALATVLPALPASLGAPVFIVQHMPALFTEALAQNLARKSAMAVKQGNDGERALPGIAYLAPGGKQMKLERSSGGEIIIRITEDPPENNCKPAVDYLFRSAALNFPGRSVAIILTGMGGDGTQGLKMLKRTGCFSIAQDEATCVVYGMPKEAVNAGVVDLIVPLGQVAPCIMRELHP
jgi:two-component system chemotaxis response regulator CheB